MDEQVVRDADSFSPSAGKPVLVLESWKSLGLPVEVTSFRPMDASLISLVHDKKYVEGVLKCEIPNGFGNTLESVAKSLPYTTGSIVSAAIYSFLTKNPSASLTSGFHHAGWDHASGFCTFEGLALATVMLLKAGAKKVGIIDLDAHAPQTMDIIDRLKLSDKVRHYGFGNDNVMKNNSNKWLKNLHKIICEFSDCDVILFQAGADPHENDPLGGVLTSEQMRLRDRLVFQTAKKMNVPVAFNLAGGYQNPIRKVLDIHDQTAIECCKVYGLKGKI